MFQARRESAIHGGADPRRDCMIMAVAPGIHVQQYKTPKTCIGQKKERFAMAEQKSCFIIMPITVPDSWLEKYRDEKEHFNHVLDCLFVPSVERAGFKPIPPKAKGSDLIHAGIIENLETADIVLCDMSCLNPNVFFEFGIRTSLNKPVCVVKDELTPKVPFDTGILNYQEYQSSLDSWLIKTEVEKLSKHLTASVERSKGQNTLWKYFGLRTEARAYEVEAGADSKLDYLALQIESMREKVDELSTAPGPYGELVSPAELADRISKTIRWRLPRDVRLRGVSAYPERGLVNVYYIGTWDARHRSSMVQLIRNKYDLDVDLVRMDSDPEGPDPTPAQSQ